MPPTYDFYCTTCDSKTDHFSTYENRPEKIECACGGDAFYSISAPNLMLKGAFLDGTKRFDKMREASKLNKEIGKQNNDADKKRISNEIRKMGVKLRKD